MKFPRSTHRLLGVSGPMQDAIKVKEQIRTFLVSELKLTLSEEKTLITHAKTEKARFLGYDIHVLHQDAKHDKRGQRSINGVIGLRVPDEKMKDKARLYKKSGKPAHRKERTVNSDFDIITQYQSKFRGFAQYYLLAYNAHHLHGLERTMELSFRLFHHFEQNKSRPFACLDLLGINYIPIKLKTSFIVSYLSLPEINCAPGYAEPPTLYLFVAQAKSSGVTLSVDTIGAFK